MVAVNIDSLEGRQDYFVPGDIDHFRIIKYGGHLLFHLHLVETEGTEI